MADMSTRHPAPQSATADEGPPHDGLQRLGLHAKADAVYRAVLRRPGVSLAEVGAQAAMSIEAVTALLHSLQARGLAVQDGTPGTWQAVAPEVAIEILLLEKQAELDDARRLAAALRRDMAREGAQRGSMAVEIIPADPQAQFEAYADLWNHARKGVLNVMRAPFTVGGVRVRDMHSAAHQRGVAVRHLLALDLLSWPGSHALCVQGVAQGVQIRTLEGLFTRMTVADNEVCIIPLDADDPSSPLLRIRNSAVLKVLVSFGEALWTQATPVLAVQNDEAQASERAEPEQAVLELVTILAAGCNDKTAADRLGVSQRTLTRRIGLLSDQLQAKSRFQCGWLAARLFDQAGPP